MATGNASMIVTGALTMAQLLDRAPDKVQRKVARRAAAKGGRVVSKRAKQNLGTVSQSVKAGAPRTGQMRKATGVKVKSYRRTATVAAIIGPRSGFRVIKKIVRSKKSGRRAARYHDPAKTGHLAEKGHGGPSPAPEHPTLGPAVKSSRSQALSVVAREMRAGLQREVRAGR